MMASEDSYFKAIVTFKKEKNLKKSMQKYSNEPRDSRSFTQNFDKFYTRFAKTYDVLVRYLPVWRNWLEHVLPYIEGRHILEISFGTGYLLTQYSSQLQVFGIDYNWAMVKTANKHLSEKGQRVEIQQADVNFLPYATDSFDTIVNTMAFSGYADGKNALTEIKRVLKPNGRLVMIDINYPKNNNLLGTKLTQFWMASGDIIRDMNALFKSLDWGHEDKEIGAFGSVHLYVATNAQHTK